LAKAGRLVGGVLVAVLATAMCAAAAAVVWLHLSVQPVLSASMRPAFAPGSLIVTRSVGASDVHPGDVIVFTPPSEPSRYAHRVASVSGPRDHPVITTKGDANPSPDPWRAAIVGTRVPKVVASIPRLGFAAVALRRHLVRAIALAAAGLVVCVIGTRDILGPRPGGADEHERNSHGNDHAAPAPA
jgi:signal peptidase